VIPNGVDTEHFRRLGLTASDRLALLRRWLVDDPHGRDESGHFEERAAEAQGLIHCSRLLCQQVAGLLESLTGSGVVLAACRLMEAFRGASLSRLLDPHRVAPGTLRRLEQIAGPSLLTSTYLRRREPLRILSLARHQSDN
jgi:hypothetical protein